MTDDGAFPGRKAMLRRASRAGIGSEERDHLLQIAVPHLDREKVLAGLREALAAWSVGYRDRAELIINDLIRSDREIEAEKAKGDLDGQV